MFSSSGSADLPLIVDGGYEELAQFSIDDDCVRWVAGAVLETERVIRRKVNAGVSSMEGAEAAEYLSKLIPLAVDETIKNHSAYGSLRWLWYLRRAPANLFEGDYATTLGYDRALAEAITWGMPDSGVGFDGNYLRYSVDRSSYRRICQLIGRVKLISDLHAMYRRVGKGALLDLSGHHLQAINDSATEQAIHIYDKRHEREHAIFGYGYGLSPNAFDMTSLQEIDPDEFLKLFLFMPCRPIELPITRMPPGEPSRLCNVRARYVPWIIDARGVIDPLELGDEWERSVLRPVACVLQLSLVLPVFWQELDWGIGNCLQAGYFISSELRAKHILDKALPEINDLLSSWFCTDAWPKSYSEWREVASSLDPCTWPLEPGGIIRPVGRDSVLVDVISMSLALDKGLRLDRSNSEIANQRADLFEIQSQSAIDQSQWCPSAALASFRARTLKRDGRHITDIDAIGERGGTLLCVSCKSFVYDSSYNRGDYNVIRNYNAKVGEAVEAWSGLMEGFRREPKGDNFDFSAYTNIIGVVCTPFVVYTDGLDALSEVAPGLRACASITEFRAWLESD